MFYGILLLGIIVLRTHPAFANLTVTPNDTVVLVNDTTSLGCSGESFIWIHTSLEGNNSHFYKDESIILKYRQLGFRMDTNQEFSERNLVIENVTTEVAGKYECEDDDDNTKHPAELIVIDELPQCYVNMDEFVGPNECSILPEEIMFLCSVRYRGNKPPELELGKLGENKGLKSTCTTDNDYQKTCILTVKADLDLHGSSFVCQTTERAAKEQYNCTTKPITILHSSSSNVSQRTPLPKGDKVVCSANSSLSCTYKWIWYEMVEDYISRTIESNDNVLIAKKIGLHQCEAKCKLRNQTCLLFPKYVEVFASENNRNYSVYAESQRPQALQQENRQWTPSVICLLILGVLPYFAFVGYLLTRRRRKRKLARERIPANEYDSQTEV